MSIRLSIRRLLAAALGALALAASPQLALAAVDANQATQADLESVRGIGPGLSGKIVAARQQGPFKDWADLVDRVAGIGPGNAGRFSQAGLTVGGSAYAVDDPAKSAAEPRRKPAREAQGAPTARAAKAAKAEKADEADKTDKPAKAGKPEMGTGADAGEGADAATAADAPAARPRARKAQSS